MKPVEIRAALRSRGLKNSDLAAALLCSEETVSRLINRRRWHRKKAEKLSEILETPFEVMWPERSIGEGLHK